MDEFLNTLKTCNKTPDFYLDSKDILDLKKDKKYIVKLNKLIGNHDFDNCLKAILIENPIVVSFIPLLVGTRDLTLDLLCEYSFYKPWVTKNYCFNNQDINIDDIIDFFDKTGLKRIFIEKEIEDVYSYILGMHLGLRSNSRKNKSGSFMENYVHEYILNMCREHNLKYLNQATNKDIKREFNIDIEDIISNRRIDIVVNIKNKLILIETNFYNSNGSKIKAVTQEFITLNNKCKQSESILEFIWITDGQGWNKEKSNLLDAINNIESVINLEYLSNKYIEKKYSLS